MAEVKDEDEVQQQQQRAHGIPPKRKTDLTLVDDDIDQNEKKLRLDKSADNDCSPVAVEKKIDGEDKEDDDEEDYEEDEEEEDGDDDEDDEDEDFDDERSNGQVDVDRKGKGILSQDKGKGKLIEESDDSSDDVGMESDGDSSDLSEDPLAEVDLDNILPSRTRRRTVRPGPCISKKPGKNHDDDSDA